MHTISKIFSFEASHMIEGLPKEHPCTNLHGHSYQVIVAFCSSELNKVGFVIDYRDLDIFKQYIDTKLDHKHLNDVFDFNPTAENISKHLFEIAVELFGNIVKSVVVKETQKTGAKYESK